MSCNQGIGEGYSTTSNSRHLFNIENLVLPRTAGSSMGPDSLLALRPRFLLAIRVPGCICSRLLTFLAKSSNVIW